MWRRHLYVQSDTLLLVDVFESFRNNCIEIYDLYKAHFLSAPGLAWQTCLKKTEVELEVLTDIEMLLIVEKELEVQHAMQYIDMQKQTINTWKNITKTMNYYISCICMQVIYMDRQCLINYL